MNEELLRTMSYEGISSVQHISSSQANFWFRYTCSHCNTQVSGQVVGVSGPIKWLICTNCGNGSVLTRENILYPPSIFGPNIDGLPTDVLSAYNEARNSYSVNAFTASELMCRKILMHVAVEKEANEGDSFENYITYLEKLGYVTPTMKPWVDLIRKHGNQSTHELQTPDMERAKSTLMFTAELLKLVYEMEHKVKQYTKSPS